MNPTSQTDFSSFIALNSDFYVQFFSSKESSERKTTSSFLSDMNLPKRTELHEDSLSSFLSTNNSLPSSASSQSLSINESDSYILDNVNKKSKLFQLEDGIAAFDPKKKILTIFTTSSIENISTTPSPLSLTSLNPFYSRKPLPFPGVDAQKMEELTGIEGLIFAHKSPFLAVFQTKEQVLQYAHFAADFIPPKEKKGKSNTGGKKP